MYNKTIIAALFAVAIVSLVGTAMAEDKINDATITAEIGEEGYERSLTGDLQFFADHIEATIVIHNAEKTITFKDMDVDVTIVDGKYTQFVIEREGDNRNLVKVVELDVSFIDDTTYSITDGLINTYSPGTDARPNLHLVGPMVPVNNGTIIFTTPLE